MKETVLSDVCFEALVLPECDEHCPKLRFPSLKVKTKKVMIIIKIHIPVKAFQT